MDSVTQLALGAAVGVAVMGRRTAVWKAALWGAVAGTLPDLDVLIDHGDPISNMVKHRAESHALLWLTLLSLPFAAGVARLHREWANWKRWWLAIGLALVTHPLLDAMTVYGTRLALPFSEHPFAVGSVFIIDPLYTLPLIVGVIWALRAREGSRGLRANLVGLGLSTAYLAWGVAAQHHVQGVAADAMARQGIKAERVLVMPTAFNSVLWRVLAVEGGQYLEGFYSLLDKQPTIGFDRFDRGAHLAAEVQAIAGVQAVAAFSKGFYKLQQHGDQVRVSDLRMGQEPMYIFSFTVAERRDPLVVMNPPVQIGARPDFGRGMPWLWRRALGEPLPPPR